jgi:formate dehydrogenase major subunit
VVDPRFTRTAAKADHHIRIRSGSDIPFLFGMLYHIFKNGWEDKKYINDRVYGMEKVKADVMAKWTPDKVEEACGVPEAQVYMAAEMMAKNRPSTVVWCMGQTQHTIGNAMVRASCILQLTLGNVGVSGGGTNIFRGHDTPTRCLATTVWLKARGSTLPRPGALTLNGSRVAMRRLP